MINYYSGSTSCNILEICYCCHIVHFGGGSKYKIYNMTTCKVDMYTVNSKFTICHLTKVTTMYMKYERHSKTYGNYGYMICET